MTGSQTTEPEREKEPTAEQNTEPADDVAELEESAAAGEAAVDAGDTNEPSGKRRLRKPTLTEASVVVGLVAGIVALVFKFAPDWQPQPDPDEINAAISDIKPRHPVSLGLCTMEELDRAVARAQRARGQPEQQEAGSEESEPVES